MDMADITRNLALKGRLITPTHPAYDQARKTLFNTTARPAVIAECANADDITQMIRFATQQSLPLSIRSGGHNGAGLSTNDGGVVIDVSRLNKVEVLDADRSIVRIGTGAQWGTVAQTLAKHSIAISSGDTATVGVGGLTLGGGIGWMVRQYGLTIDNLLAVELVTAQGKLIRASEHEHPDLFWALRGGGGNFGVATAMEFRGHYCKGIVGGSITYGTKKRHTILKQWAQYMRDAPLPLNSTAVFMPAFGPGQEPQLVILVCYADSDEKVAQAAIQPLRELGDTPIAEAVSAQPYSAMLDEPMHFDGMIIRVRNGFTKALDDTLTQIITDHFGHADSPPLQIRAIRGALNKVAADATAFAHRDAEALLVMPSFSPTGATDAQANAAADTLWAPLKPFVHGSYVNFVTDRSPQTLQAVYPAKTQKRLGKVKATYDPNNVFNRNLTITPAP